MALSDAAYSIAFYGACAWITFITLLCSYRVTLHPLKKYPGPRAAKVTDFYGFFHASLKRLYLVTWQDHQKYGPIIRHGPNKLVFSSLQAFQDIYTSDRALKSPGYLVTLHSAGVFNIFNAIDKGIHRSKRKLIGQAINDNSMRKFEPIMIDQINIFVEQLRVSRQNPVNVSERCKWLGMDIVGLLAFGYRLNLQTSPTNRFVLEGLESGNHYGNTFMQFPLLKQLPIELLWHMVFSKDLFKFFGVLKLMIKTRTQQEKDSHYDLYSLISDHVDTNTGSPIQASEIWSEATFFFPAGGDTTATALSSVFFYLSRNPHCYEKLRKEIRSTFETDEEICGGTKLNSCQYLLACIDEALRMSPPVTGTLWRKPDIQKQRKQPFIVDGHVIPPGTEVGVSIYTLHHDPQIFSEPWEFRPERWLETPDASGEADDKAQMHQAFAAFSVGSRGCAGKAMAYLESRLAIAKVLWHLDFERAPGLLGESGGGSTGCKRGTGRKDEFQLHDIFSSAHDGPHLVFRTRT